MRDCIFATCHPPHPSAYLLADIRTYVPSDHTATDRATLGSVADTGRMSEREKLTLARVAWLQSMVSHRIVPASFAKHLYARCCAVAQTAYDERTYQQMMQETSERLSVLDLELRTVRDQSSGQAVLALVNTKHDMLIQGATRYSPLEISLVKKLVEEIFKAKKEAYAIPALESVRLGSKLRTHMTRDATEELLKNLVDHRWLDYSSEGIYTLSTRSLLELGNYLQNEFEEHYHTCTHCKDVVTLGVACSYSPRSCAARYHLHCARNTIASQVDDDEALARLSGFACPGCRRPWKSRPIGPKALRLADRDTPFGSQPDPRNDESADSDQEVESQLAHSNSPEPDLKPQPPHPPQQARTSSHRHTLPESQDEQDVKPRRRLR